MLFRGSYSGEVVNAVKYSVRYGPDVVLWAVRKFSDDAAAMAVKHSDEAMYLGATSLKFGPEDLVYGPSAGGALKELQEKAGGRLLSDVGNQYDMVMIG